MRTTGQHAKKPNTPLPTHLTVPHEGRTLCISIQLQNIIPEITARLTTFAKFLLKHRSSKQDEPGDQNRVNFAYKVRRVAAFFAPMHECGQNFPGNRLQCTFKHNERAHENENFTLSSKMNENIDSKATGAHHFTLCQLKCAIKL